MRYLQAALAFTVFLAISAIAFAYSGLFNIAATETHDPISFWLMSVTRDRSIEVRSGSIQVPDLSDERLRQAGVSAFDKMCSRCHTAPGRQPSSLSLGLNPPPPDLAEEAQEGHPEEMFWVTKNGIRMTGMPAWGVTHDDDEIWSVIAFLQVLPDLDGIAYDEMLAYEKMLENDTGG